MCDNTPKLHDNIAGIDDSIIFDTDEYKCNTYAVNDLDFSSTPVKVESRLKYKNFNNSLISPSLSKMFSVKIEHFEPRKNITLSKKRKSEGPWTISKKSSTHKIKIDDNQNNDFLLKHTPNKTLDIFERNSTISTSGKAVLLKMKGKMANCNGTPELCECPNGTDEFKNPPEESTNFTNCRFSSNSCENSNANIRKEIWHQHQKCHSAPTSTPFSQASRKYYRNKLFMCHSQSDDSPAFVIDKGSLRKRFSYNFPSYDVSNFDSLHNGFFDTHCHLDFLFQRDNFKGTYEAYRRKYSDNFPRCYEGCVAVFCDPLTFEKESSWKYLLTEKGVWAAFGCHPHSAMDFDSMTENFLRKIVQHPRVVALGEIGLDYSSRNSCERETQHKIFRVQLKIAVEENMPLVIHCRDAQEDCLRILKEIVPLDYHIHRHCFTGDWKEAEIWLNTFPNLYLGITGLVTFPSAKEVHEVVKKIPLNRLLLETDAPYFVPRHETLRELKWSRPGMALHVAAQIAALRPDVDIEEILREVRKNTYRMYGC